MTKRLTIIHLRPIYFVETSKKANYDDLVATRDTTMIAVNLLSNSAIRVSPELQVKIEKAIELWELILNKSETENKKARIDRKVTQANLQNIANCHFYARNFTEAEKFALQAREFDQPSMGV